MARRQPSELKAHMHPRLGLVSLSLNRCEAIEWAWHATRPGDQHMIINYGSIWEFMPYWFLVRFNIIASFD